MKWCLPSTLRAGHGAKCLLCYFLTHFTFVSEYRPRAAWHPQQTVPRSHLTFTRAALGMQEKTPSVNLCFVKKPSMIAFLESTPQFCHIMPMVGFPPLILVLWSLIAWTRELLLPA